MKNKSAIAQKKCLVCGTWYKPLHQDDDDAGRRARERWRFKARRVCGPVCRGVMKRHPPQSAAIGRQQARRLLPPQPCQQCGETRQSQIHHKDGNPLNNDLGNLERLCLWCNRKTQRGKRARVARAPIAPTTIEQPATVAAPFEFEDE